MKSKPNITMEFSDPVTFSLTYRFGKQVKAVHYRYMSGEVIPNDIVVLMLPNILRGLAKRIEAKYAEK